MKSAHPFGPYTRIALILAAICCFTRAPIEAQTRGGGGSVVESTPQSLEKVPRLGGHLFVPNNLVRDPFIKTYVRNSLGIGQAFDIDLLPIVIDTIPVEGLKGDLLFALLEFEYQHAIKDWIAARARVRVNGRLGDDVVSLLATGIHAATAFELGWLIRLHRSESVFLSASLQLSNKNFTQIDLTRFIEDIIAGRPASLVRKTPSVRGGGGLRFAWGASPLFGLTLDASTGFGESVDRLGDDELFYRFGGALNFDVNAVSVVPIGVVVAFNLDSFPEAGNDFEGNWQSVLLRIAYNDSPDFVIALDSEVDFSDLRDVDDDLKLGSTSISMRYYF